MKLELKNIKHANWASEETQCYNAVLYVDGDPFLMVSNEGRGGADRDDQDPRFKGDAVTMYVALKSIAVKPTNSKVLEIRGSMAV